MIEFDLSPINIFDFDGTLTTETWPKCFVWIKKFGYIGERRNEELSKAFEGYKKDKYEDSMESFFAFFNDLIVSSSEYVKFEEFMEGKKYIKYCHGLKDFIDASITKNYIVSGGIKDFLDNLSIARYFEGIYGTTLKYNADGLISEIGEVMTYDRKVLAIKDILKKNNRCEDDCRNVYYIGDGYTDLEAMRFVHNNGGKAVFVYGQTEDDELYNDSNKIYEKLNKDGIIDFYQVADYSKGSTLLNILLRQNI